MIFIKQFIFHLMLAEMFVLQALSAILQADVAQTPAQYVRRHPGGALGKIRDNER